MSSSSPRILEWKTLTCDEVAALERRLPVIIPLGLIEAHGPHLPLSVDLDTAEYFSRRLAERTGAILAPLLSYGFADEMAEYPGTIGVSADTLATVMTDVAAAFCRQGFQRQLWLSGHGANKVAFECALPRIWSKYPDARLAYWNYWSEAGFNQIHHADKGETEIAMAVGTPTRMDRVRDFAVKKPWYRIRSRHVLDPHSGGINGSPTQARLTDGERMRDEILRILTDKLTAVIADETAA